ncbi:NARF isoform 13, partial [Pan troglodytes]
NLSPEKIFHVIVAPCYDKKLEALQESLPPALHGSRGADCVLTSGEIAQIMEQGDLSVRDAAVDTLNKDFQEVTLEKNGEVVLRFAAAYGFRNIQNMILKLKKGKFPFHFVEVLACAGGCLNGRGQAQTPDGHADKALLRQMEGIYADIPVRRPESSAHVQELYQEW